MSAEPANAKKILIVDDNEIILKTISLRLREAGYAPLVARDGVEALAVARREPLDLIGCQASKPHPVVVAQSLPRRQLSRPRATPNYAHDVKRSYI